jgi:hypothetical protein
VTETGEQAEDWDEKLPGIVLGEGDIYRYAWTVWWCLLLNGYPTFPPLGLYGPPNFTSRSFRVYAHRAPAVYYRRPWSVDIPGLFVHLSGDSGDKRLSIGVQWPYVVEEVYPSLRGSPMMAWSPEWLAAGIGYEWGRRRELHAAFSFKPWWMLKRWVRDRLEAWRLRRNAAQCRPDGCGCLDADEYECWRKRYHLPWRSVVGIEEDGGPCECECHHPAEDWDGEDYGDGYEVAEEERVCGQSECAVDLRRNPE